MLLNFFSASFTWIMLFILLLNMQQRKYPYSAKKRRAVLLLAALYLTVYMILIVFNTAKLPSWTQWLALAIGVVLLVIFRKACFPFKRKCVECGKKLTFDYFIGNDENLCEDCFYKKHPELKKKKQNQSMKKEDIIDSFKDAKKIEEIKWGLWEPDERCVLTYIIDRAERKILLIEKLRGMGTGLLNGPGGHIELEETAMEAAIRETKEETGLDVCNLEERGILRFQFTDGLKMIGYVFFTDSYSGTLLERTDETVPAWHDLDDIDYSRMWEDDKMWLPSAMEGKHFEGWFIFDGETLLDGKVEYEEETDEENE